MSTDPIQNIKPFLAVAGSLIAIGIGWAELNQRIDRKAEQEAVRALEARVEANERAAATEARINRVLLCRLPEVKPDSYCEGFR